MSWEDEKLREEEKKLKRKKKLQRMMAEHGESR